MRPTQKYAAVRGILHAGLLKYLVRTIEGLEYPFLVELVPPEVNESVWLCQIQGIDAMAGIVFGREDLFTRDELIAAWKKSPSSWLVLPSNKANPGQLDGFVHVDVVPEVVGDDIRWAGTSGYSGQWGDERSLTADAILADSEAAVGDFIHCGSLIRREAGKGGCGIPAATLIAGIIDRVQRLTGSPGSPRRVLAVSYPEAGLGWKGTPKEHGKKLLEAFGFSNTAHHVGKGTRRMKDVQYHDVYVLDLDRGRSELLDELWLLVAQKRAQFFNSAPDGGIELVMRDGQVELYDRLKGHGVRLQPPPRVWRTLDCFVRKDSRKISSIDLELLLEQEGYLAYPPSRRLSGPADETKPLRKLLAETRSFFRVAYETLRLTPPADFILRSGTGKDAHFTLVLRPVGR